MADERLVSIVLGPPPTYRKAITIEQLHALAQTRSDVEVRVGETGIAAAKDMIVVNPISQDTGTLTLIDGRLQINNPNDTTIIWMLELGKALSGRVRDNTYRTFRTPREKYIHPDDLPARKSLAKRLKTARNGFIPFTHTIIKWGIILFFLLFGITLFSLLRK